jgi:hypothetical protein
MGHGKSTGAVCDPMAFAGLVIVEPGILGPKQGSVGIDLVARAMRRRGAEILPTGSILVMWFREKFLRAVLGPRWRSPLNGHNAARSCGGGRQ